MLYLRGMKNKKIYSWAMYDWANSSFSTTIMAGFFPVFLKLYWGREVDPVVTTANLGSTLSFAGLGIALLSPFLGALADLRGMKKYFLFVFMFIGVVGSLGLAFVKPGDWQLALWIYGLSYMGFYGSCTFYDSLLPSVAQGPQANTVSSLGYAAGYIGGGVLFLLNVVWYLKPEWFGFADGIVAVKASFASVGIWWLLFSIPLFLFVPEPSVEKTDDSPWKLTVKSLKALKKTFLSIKRDKNLFLSLVAYWLYIDGVYTVITMAVDYGMAIGLKPGHLMSALLITQFVGGPFAYLFGRLADKWGCKTPILICIGVYSLTTVLATQMSESLHFYILAIVVGMVQGGVQALSRSLFSNMVPEEKSGEYFAFFNLVGKFASILGPVLITATVLMTKNTRYGMMGLLVLFIIGGYLLSRVREPQY